MNFLDLTADNQGIRHHFEISGKKLPSVFCQAGKLNCLFFFTFATAEGVATAYNKAPDHHSWPFRLAKYDKKSERTTDRIHCNSVG